MGRGIHSFSVVECRQTSIASTPGTASAATKTAIAIITIVVVLRITHFRIAILLGVSRGGQTAYTK